MEGPFELQAKLDRAEAHVERRAGHIVRQKALIARTLDHGEHSNLAAHLNLSIALLGTLEATQRLHISHRDLLRKELVAALLALREPELDRLNRKVRRRRLMDDALRRKNARLRDRIAEVVSKHHELRDIVDTAALKQGMWTRIGVPFLQQVRDNLRERALAVLAVKPELRDSFKGLLR